MVKYLYTRLTLNEWFSNAISGSGGTSIDRFSYVSNGVLLRRARDDYVFQPPNISPVLVAAVTKLNVEVAFTMCTDTTDAIIKIIENRNLEMLVLDNGSHYQIADSLADIASSDNVVKKFQYACIIREERLVLVWHDSLDKIMEHAMDVEKNLLAWVWGSRLPAGFSRVHSAAMSVASVPGVSKNLAITRSTNVFSEKAEANVTVSEYRDPEKQFLQESLDRPLQFTTAIITGLATMLIIILMFGLALSTVSSLYRAH
jgi:hypothetical protein